MADPNTLSDQAREDSKAIEDFIVDEPTDEVLRISLDKFEGPVEVLLYLIKAQEIDIFDIPIVLITQQYMKFLELMHEENLDVAGEYLVMAATLIQIKSRMILPVDAGDEEEEEEIEEDPRMELVQKLIEHRKYRDVMGRLQELEEERSNWYTRRAKPVVEADPDEEEYIEVTLFDLAKAFKNVSRFLTEEVSHVIGHEYHSVDQKIDELQRELDRTGSVAWIDVFNRCGSREELLCCFLAILELCRMGKVRAHQHIRYGDIRLVRAPELRVA